jgi:hypothetical protein
MKGKSDYVTSPLSDAGLSTLMNEINRHGSVYVICDSYGGAIGNAGPDATAFAHRSALYCIQYEFLAKGERHAKAPRRYEAVIYGIAPILAAHTSIIRTLTSDYAAAYWDRNLPHLMQIKSAFDPNNIFHHAQSVPLA